MSEEQNELSDMPPCPYCGGEAIEDIIILINGKPATRCARGCVINGRLYFTRDEWLALPREEQIAKPDDYCPDCGGKTTFKSDETIANECQCSKELSIIDEAINLINGDRQQQYGDPATAATEIAAAWSAMLGINIKPPMYRIMAAAEKIIREDHQRKADNRIDALGELFLAARMIHGVPGWK